MLKANTLHGYQLVICICHIFISSKRYLKGQHLLNESLIQTARHTSLWCQLTVEARNEERHYFINNI